jgi:subtilase family serine protease
MPARAALGLARPVWATPERFAGSADPNEPIAIQVHLRLRESAAAEAELAAISDPGDPHYARFLSDEEFARKYGPSEDDVAAVRAHLEAHGLKVTYVPGNRAFVAAEGRVEQVGRAFSTRLGTYRVGEELRRAPIDEPQLPDPIKGRVLATMGVSTPTMLKPTFVRAGQKPGKPQAPNDFAGVTPCSEWYGATADFADPPYGAGYPALTYSICGYRPGQVRQAYGFESSIRKGNDGHGQSVAVVDAYLSSTLQQDAQTYAAQNDPDYPLADGQLSIVQAPGTPTPPIAGWDTEQTLDVEAVHAIAPGAKIVAVVAQSQSDQDLAAAVNLVIDKKLATVVSNSYETQEEMALTQALIWKNLAVQAGLKGVGLYFSSGEIRRSVAVLRTADDPLPRFAPDGHLGRRHVARARQRQSIAVGNGLGDGRELPRVPAPAAAAALRRRNGRRRRLRRRGGLRR